jgi:hypothetical protein
VISYTINNRKYSEFSFFSYEKSNKLPLQFFWPKVYIILGKKDNEEKCMGNGQIAFTLINKMGEICRL